MRALILTDAHFEDSELQVPCEALQSDGISVDIAAPHKDQKICGKHGLCIRPDLAITEVEPARYDLLILPGGKAPEKLRKIPRVPEIVRAFQSAGKPIAAICHGPLILAEAGILKGKKVTAYHAVREEIEAAGATFIDAPVVRDGNLITSRTPRDLDAFVAAIRDALHIG